MLIAGFATGCAGDDNAEGGTGETSSETGATGDGDGDPTGDGDGDPGTGDGDGDPTGDGDGDPTGDGDGDEPTGDGDGGQTTGDGDGDGGLPPEVWQDAQYAYQRSTHIYAEAQRHENWGGPVSEEIELLLELWEPTDAPLGRPAMVMIHGGGFVGGTRNDANMVAFAEYFAERGWVTVSIDYRLVSDRGTVSEAWADTVELLAPPQQINQAYALYPAARDAKAAVRWLVANADTYQIDTDYLTTVGGSAGSYLAITLGVTEPEDFRDEVDAMDDPTLATTNLGAGSEVHTIIDHWGGITHMEILEAIDGVSRFDATDAPVSIVHGTADATVAFNEAEKLRDAYLDSGVEHAFHPLEGAGHGAWGQSVDGMNLRELAFAFVVQQQGLLVPLP